MKKLFLIPLMTLMCSVMAWGAEVEIAQIGATTYYQGDEADAENHIYATAQEALNATIADVADEGIIKLLNSVTGQFSLGSGLNKTITFDLNGKTLTCTTGININGGSKLILVNTDTQNEGCINNTSTSTVYVSAIRVQANAELEINDGVIVQTSGNLYTVYGYANSTITINGGTIKHIGTTAKDVVYCKGATLTMNDGTIESTTKWDAIYAQSGAQITMNGGLITNTCTGAAGYAIDLYGNTSGSGDPIATTLTINGGSIVSNTAQKGYGISIWGNGATLNMTDGAITANHFAITGNGTAKYGGTTINISGGSLSSATAGAAIYHPQAGTLNITGGTITGQTGIGMKGGTLNISGGTIHAVGSNGGRVEGYNNGIYPSFAAVQIESNPGYAGNMNITVSDNATLISDSWYAFYEYLSNPDATTKVNSIAVSGGKFQGGILTSQSLASKGGFVSGGKWSKDVAAHIKVGENLSLLNNEDDDNPPYLYLVGVPTPAQEADYAEKDASNNAVLTNSASQSAAESYSSDNVGENPDVITTKETNPVVVSENTDVVATETAPIVEVKTLTVESDDDQLAVLTVTNGATLKVGAGAVHLGENAQLVVEQGAALIVDGLIYGATEDNLVIKSSEANAGILLFSPETEFISEDHPAASVKLYTQSKQVSTYPLYDYLWQRFAIPVIAATIPSNDYVNQTLFDGETGFETYLFGWGGQGWVQPANGWLGLEPNKGYQLANNTRNGGITYTFEGNLIGNHDGNYSFESTGFEFFGNSYTAPIYVRHLLSQIESQSDLEATINVYDMEHDRFLAMKTATFQDFDEGFDDVEIFEEIASMQAFILKGNAGVTAEMSYANAIWENPRFNPSNSNPAPQRRSVSSNRDIVVLNVAANGTKDRIVLRQSDEFSAEFDNSADASKYMNEGTFNIYANTEIGDLAEVSTDELNNTILGFQSAEATEYTLTCSGQKGESFILRDLLTGAEVNLEKGATYTFAQQPNTTNEARFQIVDGRMAPTAVENVQNVKKAEGIYTVLGKYLGAADQLDKLPAGMYIVNGVKIVK